uniref:Retrotransposon Copia-like N-terminal domain-containing protein n=1 Tax=Oryza brachyantha TaxID=4533 RepID=J3L176_ORYBR
MASTSKINADNPLVGQPVSEKLGKTNHAVWKAQVLATVRGARLEGHLTGDDEPPVVVLQTKDGEKETVVSNPEYDEWIATDQQNSSFGIEYVWVNDPSANNQHAPLPHHSVERRHEYHNICWEHAPLPHLYAERRPEAVQAGPREVAASGVLSRGVSGVGVVT